MKVKDFDDFSAPKRKPWLLLVVLLIVGLVVIQRYRSGDADTADEAPPEKPTETKKRKPDFNEHAPAVLPVTAGTAAADRLLSRAKALEKRDVLVEARRTYLNILKRTADKKVRAEVERQLGRISIELALSPREMPEKIDYTVQRGDSVEKIARKFGTTVEAVQKGNFIMNPNRINAGDRIRVLKAEFSMEVNTSRNDLVVYMNKEFFKRYAVGTGKYGKTPEGTFVITEKIRDPVWWRPDGKEVPFGDPENILGTRWMTLRASGDTPDARGYGIHGTWDNSSVGRSESAGCIRMKNSDVEELFALVAVNTPVTITK